MLRWIGATILATGLVFGLTTEAEADTITLKNGVRVDGMVYQQDENVVKIRIGDIERSYAAASVADVSENEKTGHFDPMAAIGRSRKRLASLENKTGLTYQQRQEIESLFFAMQSEDPKLYRDKKRDALNFHESTAPLDKYLPYALDSFEPNLIGGVLDVFQSINTFEAALAARDHITCPVPAGRAMALEVFAKGEAPSRINILARGMVDPHAIVRIAAARALGQLNAKSATPLLVDAAGSGYPRLVVVANTALGNIWNAEFETQAEWQSHWEENKSKVDEPLVQLAMLPLVEPGVVYSEEE